MNNKTYSLRKIADWLLNPEEVSLPVIQRGFVWKPSQIENLWDSIFRDYPVGAFMLTTEGARKMILDGQQRATSIALGFFNPWESAISKIGNAKNLPVLWVDVAPTEITMNSEFVFRVTTRSHPWGYQLKNNTKPLSVQDRRKASEEYEKIYGIKIYTQLKPSQRLPYDAHVPVPLCFMIEACEEASKYEEWRSLVLAKCQKYIPSDFYPKYLCEHSYYESLLDCELESFYTIISSRLMEYLIPAIIVENKLILSNNDNAVNNPTLFVRLNSAGTNLEGEELIYSIYKAVCPQTKDLVENIGNNLIAPSRIIVLASRLIKSILSGNYIKGINLIQFQRDVSDEEFMNTLKVFTGIDEQNSELGRLVKRALDVLKYDGTIPDVIVKKFIREEPNGFLILLNWLYYNKQDVSMQTKRLICSRLYRIYWFGRMEYFVSQMWGQSKSYDFWYIPICDEYMIQQPLINPDLLEDFLLVRLENPVEDHTISKDDKAIWDAWTDEFPRAETISEEYYDDLIKNEWANFLYKLLTNKSLILFAQRDYINREFKDFNQMEDLQDTNTPWDWDHIYPQSWVYYQWNIDDRTKRWEWRIGNFRAMSLTDNRSENANLSPASRFPIPNLDYFIKENDLEYWSKLNDDHKYIKEWDSEYVLIHAKAIILRTVNIYREFYNMFI